MCVEGVFSGEHAKQLHMVICEHLFRKGKLDVADRIIKVNVPNRRGSPLYNVLYREKLSCRLSLVVK